MISSPGFQSSPRPQGAKFAHLSDLTALNLIPVLFERLHLELDVEVTRLGLLGDLLDGLLDGVVVDPREAHLHLVTRLVYQNEVAPSGNLAVIS